MITVYSDRRKMIFGIGLAVVLAGATLFFLWHSRSKTVQPSPPNQAESSKSENFEYFESISTEEKLYFVLRFS